MEAHESAEIIRAVKERSNEPESPFAERFNRAAALLTAILATFLAFATVSTGAATRNQLNTNIHAADLRSDADATTVRIDNQLVTADILQSMLDTNSGVAADARAAVQQRIASYQAAATQLEGNAATGTGIEAQEAQVTVLEQAESRIEKQILSFEYSEVTLQIGIVLASVAILITGRRLFYGCCGLGVLGILLIVNGFFPLVSLPSTH